MFEIVLLTSYVHTNKGWERARKERKKERIKNLRALFSEKEDRDNYVVKSMKFLAQGM